MESAKCPVPECAWIWTRLWAARTLGSSIRTLPFDHSSWHLTGMMKEALGSNCCLLVNFVDGDHRMYLPEFS